jgi:hypothetical protein
MNAGLCSVDAGDFACRSEDFFPHLSRFDLQKKCIQRLDATVSCITAVPRGAVQHSLIAMAHGKAWVVLPPADALHTNDLNVHDPMSHALTNVSTGGGAANVSAALKLAMVLVID